MCEMSKIRTSLAKWKSSLLDTTKRNRAINFKKLKAGTIDVVYPPFADFLTEIEKKSLQFVDLFDGPDEKRSQDENKKYVFSKGLSILKKNEYSEKEIDELISNFILKRNANNVTFSSSYNDVQTSKLNYIA